MKQRIKNKDYTPKEYMCIIKKRFDNVKAKGLHSPKQGFFVTGKIKRLHRLLNKEGYKYDYVVLNSRRMAINVYNNDQARSNIHFNQV